MDSIHVCILHPIQTASSSTVGAVGGHISNTNPRAAINTISSRSNPSAITNAPLPVASGPNSVRPPTSTSSTHSNPPPPPTNPPPSLALSELAASAVNSSTITPSGSRQDTRDTSAGGGSTPALMPPPLTPTRTNASLRPAQLGAFVASPSLRQPSRASVRPAGRPLLPATSTSRAPGTIRLISAEDGDVVTNPSSAGFQENTTTSTSSSNISSSNESSSKRHIAGGGNVNTHNTSASDDAGPQSGHPCEKERTKKKQHRTVLLSRPPEESHRANSVSKSSRSQRDVLQVAPSQPAEGVSVTSL
jgi:hypothetical protein